MSFISGPVSSFLTVLTILMSAVVISYWKDSALKSIKKLKMLNAEQWFIVGVFIGFIGQALDNIYWLLAWSFNYIDDQSKMTSWFFSNGVYFNIPSRQLCGLIAAYCHVKSITLYSKEEPVRLKSTLFVCASLAFTYSLILFFKK